MEVAVLGTQGISDDSIISVRVGSTRRQAPLATLDKAFKFPCKVEDCGGVKIDVFDPVGSARAMCCGGPSDFTLELEAPDAGAAPLSRQEGAERPAKKKISFRIRPAAADGTDANAQEDSRVKKKQREWAATERYLDDHNVLAFLQDLLTGLIKDKPVDPYGFVAKQFSARAPKDLMRRLNALSTVPEEDEQAEAGTPQEEKEQAAAAAPEVGDLRQKAREVLIAGADQGQLKEALGQARSKRQEKEAPVPEELRDKAREALIVGASDGRLVNALQQALGEGQDEDPASDLRVKACAALEKGLLTSHSASAPEAATVGSAGSGAHLCVRALGTLSRGAESGELQRVLKSLFADPVPVTVALSQEEIARYKELALMVQSKRKLMSEVSVVQALIEKVSTENSKLRQHISPTNSPNVTQSGYHF